MPVPTYFDQVDHRALLRDYPIGPEFLATFRGMSRDELRARQEARFRQVLARAWQIPFYQRHWGAAGAQPGDIRSLEDATRLPAYGKSEIMRSIAEHPPFGDFHGMETAVQPPQVVLHTTSGTTGRPQPLLWGPKSRELQNLMLARAYLLQGLRRDDVVHSIYGHGMVNGGHYAREAVLHFTSAVFLSAGTGHETRSRQQVELMRTFRPTVIVGFADYIRHLAEVAREAGIEPGRDIPVRMICGHFGRESRDAIGAAWGGAQTFDWYGVADTGTVAAEGPDRDGMHLMEDAHWVELIDPDSGRPSAEGEPGNMCVTVLFKDDIFPVVRFNTNDLSAVMPGESALGLPFRRLRGFLGRSDNMVKLRGINVYPTAIGGLLQALPFANGEYLCRVERQGGRDDMTVLFEVRSGSGDAAALAEACRQHLRQRLGVDLRVEAKAAGELAPLTEIESRQKPIRLVDRRFA